MAALSATYYGSTLLAWIIAAGMFLILATGLSLARILVLRKVHASSNARAFFLVAVRHTRYVFLVLVALSVATTAIQLPVRAPHIIGQITAVIVLVQIAWWLHGILNFWVRRVTRQRAASNVGSVTTIRALGIAARVLIWTVLLVAVMGSLGIDVTALVAGLGIGGIAVALAVQNIASDLFASISIIIDKPFLVGDFIKVGEQLGTVEQIGVQTTRVRSLSGEQLIFGNADLLKSRIQNFKRMQERRVVFEIGVEYGTSPEVVEAIPGMIRTAIQALPDTRVDRIHFKSYGDSALVFESVFYVLSPDYNVYMDRQQAINLALYRQFGELGISFAFPSRTVMLKMLPEAREDIAARIAGESESSDKHEWEEAAPRARS